MIEEPECIFHAKDVADSIINSRFRYSAALDRLSEVGDVGTRRHVHVNAGGNRLYGGISVIYCKAVVHHFRDAGPIADDKTAKMPLISQDTLERVSVSTGRYAVYLIERTHHGSNSRLHCGSKSRKVNLVQRLRRYVGNVVVPPALGDTVSNEVLGAGHHAFVGGKTLPLKTANSGSGDLGYQKGVFSSALGDAPPPGVPRYIHHRRKGPVGAGGTGLDRRNTSSLLDQLQIPTAGLGERDRENGVVPVDYVVADQEWDFVSRLLDSGLLQSVGVLGPVCAQKCATLS